MVRECTTATSVGGFHKQEATEFEREKEKELV